MCRRIPACLNFGGTSAAVVASAVAVAATVATADPAMEFALEAVATSPVTAAAAEDAAAATTEDGSAMRVASVSGTDGTAARWDQLLLACMRKTVTLPSVQKAQTSWQTDEPHEPFPHTAFGENNVECSA